MLLFNRFPTVQQQMKNRALGFQNSERGARAARGSAGAEVAPPWGPRGPCRREVDESHQLLGRRFLPPQKTSVWK